MWKEKTRIYGDPNIPEIIVYSILLYQFSTQLML